MTISDNMRRIIAIVIFAAAALLIGWLLYLAFFAPSRTANNNNGLPANGQLPNVNGAVNRSAQANVNRLVGLPLTNQGGGPPSVVANGGLTVAPVIVDAATLDASLAGNGVDLNYYDRLNGKFFRLDRSGTKTLLTDAVFKGVEDIVWSPDKDQAVLSFKDESKIIYDFRQKRQTTLPKELEDFSWSPDASQLAAKFIGPNEGDNWLAVVNSDGSAAKTIEPLGDKASQVSVDWSPGGQIVATYQQALDGERTEIVPLGIAGENYKTIETAGRGFQGQWDPTGQQLLYSVHSASTSYNPNLYIVNASGDSLGAGNLSLGLATWADKCAFASTGNDLYCAVPLGLERGSGLYPELAANTIYEFYRVDLTTGNKTLLALPTDSSGLSAYPVDKVFLAATQDQLFFTDQDGKIHSLKLR